MTFPARNVVLAHLVGNAIVLWLGYEWLGIGESSVSRLVVSAAAALAILALFCWLHAATFAGFRGAARNLAPLLVAAIAVIVVYGLLAWAASAANQPAFKLASWLTLHMRKPVKPATVARVFQAVFWVVRWVVLPVGLLPMAAAIATCGWRGFAGLTWRANWRYWLAVPVLLVIGLVVPFLLLRWIPGFDAFGMQFASFLVRILVGYLLFVGAALAVERLTAARK